MAKRFFRLVKAASYEVRSKASGKLYIFSSKTPVGVENPIDQLRFEAEKKILVEVDEKGNILDTGPKSDVPMAFTRHGMVPPKSYTKMVKAPSEKPVGPAPVASPPPAVRTVTSAKAAEPAKAEPVEDASAEIPKAEMVADNASVDAAIESTEKSDSASEDSAPKKRTKRSRKKKSGTGDE